MPSFFSLFVYVFFPLPALLLVLLMLPLPGGVKNWLVKLTDGILFVHPHPNIPLSLFWLSLGVSAVTLFSSYQSYSKNQESYASVRANGGLLLEPRIKLLASERNLWISASATCLWIILHRFRNLQKRFHRLELELSTFEAENKSKNETKKDK